MTSKIQAESMNLADTYAFTGTVTGAGESNTPYFRATGTTFSPSNNTWTKMQMGSTTFTVGSTYDTSNYRWTPNVAGYYYCYGVIRWYTNPGAPQQLKQDNAAIYKNGSAEGTSLVQVVGNNGNKQSINLSWSDTADSDDYYEAYVYHNIGSTEELRTDYQTIFMGYKVIGA